MGVLRHAQTTCRYSDKAPARACASGDPRHEIDGRAKVGSPDPRRGKAVDNGGLPLRRNGERASPAVTHRHSSRPSQTKPSYHVVEASSQALLDQPGQAKHHPFDPRKQTPGGRHQIGTPAGFKSELVAGFLLECPAGFVGIRK